MPDVTKRLAGPIAVPTTSTTLYTVPIGVTTVVRNIHVTSTVSSGYANFYLALNAAASANTGSLYFALPVAPNAAFDWSGFMVISATGNAGNQDYLTMWTGTVNALTITVSGVEQS